MESNHVNFNFEYDLYGRPAPSWMDTVLKPSMECLYFYCNETLPLATNLKYDEKYLENLGAKVVPLSSMAQTWWGEFNPISKKSNCKLENHRANKTLKLWTPEGGIIDSFEDLKTQMGEGRWRLKDPWLMGGTGQWRISREMLDQESYKKGIIKRLEKGSLLLERSLDIETVVGTTFNLMDKKSELLFSVENFLNTQGNFLGGKLIELPSEIKDQLTLMSEYWRELGARGIFEIDSFILEGNIYPCVEVNHRKTMGWFIWNLTKKFGSGELRIESDTGIRLNPSTAPLKVCWTKF